MPLVFPQAVAVVALMAAAVAAQQLPGAAVQISQQCRPYTGTACAGVVDYAYLSKGEKEDAKSEDTVRAALKKVEGKMYECRAAAKRFSCASTFTKCRTMAMRAGGPSSDRFPALSSVTTTS